MPEWLDAVWTFAENVATFVFVVGGAYAAYLWFIGVIPVLFRLGNLRKRKIAIFAKGDASGSLSALFADAKLFNKRNIIPITSVADFGRAEKATIFVVHWPDWTGDLAQILARKSDETPLIVYAPQIADPIPPAAVAVLDEQRHVVVTNFRGRLLNDVVGSFITTAYEKR
jgi:hypothetical protein